MICWNECCQWWSALEYQRKLRYVRTRSGSLRNDDGWSGACWRMQENHRNWRKRRQFASRRKADRTWQEAMDRCRELHSDRLRRAAGGWELALDGLRRRRNRPSTPIVLMTTVLIPCPACAPPQPPTPQLPKATGTGSWIRWQLQAGFAQHRHAAPSG